jgi:endopolyphosphatase
VLQFFYLHRDDLVLPSVQDKVEATKKDSLVKSLMDDFGQLPKEEKTDLDDYAIINVSPSVVPNPFLPSFRIFSYNVTDVDELVYGASTQSRWKTMKRNHGHRHSEKDRRKVDCKKKENQDTWDCRPKKPYHAHAESPSRKNQLWSPLGYAQVSACGSATREVALSYRLLRTDTSVVAGSGINSNARVRACVANEETKY